MSEEVGGGAGADYPPPPPTHPHTYAALADAEWQRNEVVLLGEARSVGHVLPVSRGLLDDAGEPLGLDLWRDPADDTPEQAAERARRTAAWDERQAALRAERAAERAAAAPVPLTLELLLDALGLSRELAEHLVQPWCACDLFGDAPYRCAHAEDLGVGYR